MKRAYTKQLYERIYKQTRIKPDPQVFLGMATRAQTVDTRPFFFYFSSGLGTRLGSPLASFPGLPRLQFCILQVIKNWSWGSPGNEVNRPRIKWKLPECNQSRAQTLSHVNQTRLQTCHMSKQSPSAIQNLQVNPNHATYKFVKKTYTHHWAITTVHKWSQQSSVTKQIYERRRVHEMAVIELSQTQSWQSGSDNHPNAAWQLRKPLNRVTGWSSGILKPHTCVRHDNVCEDLSKVARFQY